MFPRLGYLWLVCCGLILPACSRDVGSPVAGTEPSSTGLDFDTYGRIPASSAPAFSLSASATHSSADEEFNCTNLQEHHVRFSDPGYVHDNFAGLFYYYVGAPPGRKKLEIFWDEADESLPAQIVDLGEGEIQRNDPNRFDLSGVLEHVYAVSGQTERQVRVNFIVDGLTGNCATVRRISLGPGSLEECVPAPSAGFAGSLSVPGPTQTGRIYRDGTASSCPSKTYPGDFGSITQVYSVHTFHNEGSRAACFNVNFRPDTGASPCWTGSGTGKAHASAYLRGYDPANRASGFLGDIGLSAPGSFRFEVPGDTDYVVVVSSVSGPANCTYEFTLVNTDCP